ncbi:L-type lectin-domain containing receptor kinase IX.1-like [Malus sylvestris]|uniref:L-type lectin-domain containing receptor kinase IX.1-like n=1 Tax=Malus sylvestris TaxID=3752 RepID=UPI0021ACE2FB|nr:L-type lectin-domain containing receptor kinase IX.1-like [Malus sylvestris]
MLATMISASTLRSQKLHFLLVLFFLLTPSVTPLSFSFPSFIKADDANISAEGDALIDHAFLRLTKSAADEGHNDSVGRATYSKPFLLKEHATGKLADFTTSFEFIIDSLNNSNYGDGLAFFIAPNGSVLNPKLGQGSSLGLPFNSTPSNDFAPRNQYAFVAVEFDIYWNYMQTTIDDPQYNHVGIDVNSLKSSKLDPWDGGIMKGIPNSATITYNSSSKNLSVAFTTSVKSDSRQKMRCFYYIVDLKHYLPDWVVVGFSASTGASIAIHKIIWWNFTSTSLVDYHEADTAPPPLPVAVPVSSPMASSTYPPKTVNKPIGLVIGLGIGGCAVVVTGLGLVWFILWKRRETGESSDEDTMVHELVDEEFEKGACPRKFSYRELARATNNFGQEEKLGEGGFGGVYKGIIPDLESPVAVKRMSRGSKQGLKEYASEVKIISRLRHRNLVQLIGWCHERKFLLVYEFMPKGSLDSHLFKEQSLLTWEARYKIAQGLASGLFYLHQEWEQCVLHRDIKSSNVMLDANFNAKLGDFGLARLVDHGQEPQTTALAGTMGYMAPEYVITGKASKESDVYSFGIVALEICCGRKPIDPKFGSSKVNMVEWVWELYGEEKVIEAADPKLCGDFVEKQMECLMIVGLWCAHPDNNMRPSIQQAIQVLNFEVPLPNLPSKMPVATYFAPSRSLSKLSVDASSSQGVQTEISGYAYNTNSSELTGSSSATNSNPSISLGSKCDNSMRNYH